MKPYRYLQELYSRLFDHLVRQINASTSAESSSVHRTIALLDIFGFEMFKVNSFEVRSNADAKIIYVILRTPLINFVGTPCLCQQFCINFANEKLQQKFTHDVFKIVQAEYEEVRSITRGSSTVASSSVTENLLYHFS
jgi:myosin-5